jgi:type II secretory pathway pseudopilin PulG
MYSKLMQTKAITLTELIIAMSIVGVIMLGVVSSDYAVHKQSSKATSSAQASLSAQGILQKIITNAINAQGSGSVSDKGICGNSVPGVCTDLPQSSPGVNDFCIRTVRSPESWACYTPVASSLYYCQRSTFGSCVNTDTGYINLGTISSVSAIFTTNNASGTAQIVFSVAVTVPDSLGTAKTMSASITPPTYSY